MKKAIIIFAVFGLIFNVLLISKNIYLKNTNAIYGYITALMWNLAFLFERLDRL